LGFDATAGVIAAEAAIHFCRSALKPLTRRK
jgi:hypothetical protein